MVAVSGAALGAVVLLVLVLVRVTLARARVVAVPLVPTLRT
jgi:hypothetical protein